MSRELVPVTNKPRKVSKLGGSAMVAIPPLFFKMAGLDRERSMQAELFYDRDDGALIVRLVYVPEEELEPDEESVVH